MNDKRDWEEKKSILDDIVPGNWQTRLEVLSSDVDFSSMMRNPKPILVDVDMLVELLWLANKSRGRDE